MASKETAVSKDGQVQAGMEGSWLFRNSRGLFYTLSGEKTRAGLETDGASDLIGFTQVVITPEMVGRTMAIFTAAEAKVPTWKKPTTVTEKKQEKFINWVTEMGGIALFFNDAKLIKLAIDKFKMMR